MSIIALVLICTAMSAALSVYQYRAAAIEVIEQRPYRR